MKEKKINKTVQQPNNYQFLNIFSVNFIPKNLVRLRIHLKKHIVTMKNQRYITLQMAHLKYLFGIS